MYEINLANRLSQACAHLVTDRARLFTDHGMSGLPIRARHKHFNTICEHTSDNSPTDSSSSFLNWWSSKQDLKLCAIAHFSCLPVRSTSPRTFEHVLPCHRTMQLLLRSVLPIQTIFSVAPAEIRDSNIFVSSSIIISSGLHSRWVHPK